MIKRSGGVQVGGACAPGTTDAQGWGSMWDANTLDFNRDAFTRLLSDKGYDVTWQKAIICPNRVGVMESQHDINCAVCHNASGFLYYDDIRTRMLITGMRVDQSFYAFGRWDGGTISVTALPEMRLNHWDRILLHNGVARFHELVFRNATGLVDMLKYAPLTVDHVVTVTEAGQTVVYTDGVHFKFLEDQLTWLGSTRPANGQAYSVAYTYRPRYIIQDLMHQHRESTVNGQHLEFPTQGLARLEYLVRDEGKDAPSREEVNPFPSWSGR